MRELPGCDHRSRTGRAFCCHAPGRRRCASVAFNRTGPGLSERYRDQPCGILCGWGGAGAYSDGKLILSPEVGGFPGDLVSLNELKSICVRQ